ncbi:MAG TPA: DNA helicase RecQ [Gammaproteobacteria bacterium]|nr:DNA helicase RecQ [Gammaproteobacteria bacterium]
MQTSLLDLPAPAQPADPRRVLREVFGYDEFRGQQAAIIGAALAGRDALVLMPTGGGKSLCYQIPALLRDGVGIVVSPLIALMEDQVGALREAGVAAAFLNSSLARGEQQRVIDDLKRGRLKLLYVAPERLVQEETRALLAQVPISIVAIDEAHCVSQWGHDFRQEYLALNDLARWFPGVPRMALTATATPPTRDEIVARLELQRPEVFVGSFDRPNIRYHVQTKSEARRQLAKFLEGHRGEAGIVYCLARKKTEETADWLRAQGFDALPYHAGLPSETRAAHQRRFLNEDGVIVVATIAFGMGIDKPDVRFVAHLDLPKSMEAYYQETGRAGRDGEPADAWMVYGLQDVVQLRQLVDSSEAGEQHKWRERRKLDALLGWCEVTTCRRRPLLAYFGEQQAGADAGCGNCDNCLTPPRTWDGTEAARKLLSAVYRTGQSFGAAHVIDVLLGNTTDKVARHRHERLSVYGIGTELGAPAWRSLLRQLVVRGYLRVDNEYGALVLTEESRGVLRGAVEISVREDPKETAAPRKKARGAAAEVAEQDRDLWEALRECRRALAAELNLPPYVIFHDATLREMVAQRPASRDALLRLHGVGQAKLERYGDRFLAVLQGAGHTAVP